MKIDKETFTTVYRILIIILLCFMLRIVYKVNNTVSEFQDAFKEQIKKLGVEGADYLKEEYADDAKEAAQETVDTLKSRLKKILKND
jgi:D-alanyl-D-alanine carboxypeptidase